MSASNYESTFPVIRDFSQIPRFRTYGNPENGTATPEWMIRMDNHLHSTLNKFEKYAQLFGFTEEAERRVLGHAVNSLTTSSMVRHSETVVILPNNSYVTHLEVALYGGLNINEIEIVRLVNIGQNNKENLFEVAQSITYNNCMITLIQQRGDEIYLAFRAVKRTNKIQAFTQDGGLKGSSVASFDTSLGKISLS